VPLKAVTSLEFRTTGLGCVITIPMAQLSGVAAALRDVG
jgi:hypothetical protein